MIPEHRRLCISCLLAWGFIAVYLLVGSVWALIELLGPA